MFYLFVLKMSLNEIALKLQQIVNSAIKKNLLSPVRTAQLVACRLVLGRSGVQILPSPIEFSIGERLQERF